MLIQKLRLISMKIWILLVFLYIIPFIFDRDVSYNTDSLWVLYLIPAFIFSYYFGISGGIISGLISSFIHFSWEYNQAMNGEENPLGLFTAFQISFIGLLISIGVGFLADKLKQSQKNLTDILNHINAGVWSENLRTKEVTVSKGMEMIYGQSAEIFRSNTEIWLEVIHPDDQSYVKQQVQIAMSTGESVKAEYRIFHSNGDIRWISDQITPIIDSYGTVTKLTGVVMDITERKMTEELLQNADKLSAVGELAAGIAHEIRNPLTSLRGFVQLDRNDDIDNKRKLHYEVMLSEIDRINGIVSELLVLAKPTKELYLLRGISEELNDVITLFEGQLNLYNVEIIKEFDKDLPLIRCHHNLKQVFINVFKNALESMPNGGKTFIQAKMIDDYVCVRFIDQGCGIPNEELSKIGNPFFTTKETGTGLGIMVSKQIIQNHKGTMRIESEEGKGTTVEILLPVH